MDFRKVVWSRVFVISLLLFLGVFFLISANTTQWFNVFSLRSVQQNIKLWSSFAKDTAVQSPALGLALAQSKLWSWYTSGADGSVGGGLWLYDQTAALVEVDIVKLMAESSDPWKILDTHLAQIDRALEQIGAQYELFKAQSDENNELSKACYARKRLGDREFFDGVNTSDSIKANSGLDTSLAEAPCYITNRIYANAYAYMAQRVLAYQRVLVSRLGLLSNNRTTLLQTYPLLYGNVAEDLVTLKNNLYSINAMSYSDFDEYFRFTVPSIDETIPKLEKVIFYPDDVPNFKEPE